MKTRSSVRTLLFAALLALFCLTPAHAQTDLISSLTDQLGITESQATGGAGAIFDYAKDNLSADDFTSLAKGIPNMDSLLGAAPEEDSGSAMGQLGSMLGGSGSSMGGLASLASSFESLGLDPELVSQFLPIVEQYVGQVSGEDAMALLAKLF